MFRSRFLASLLNRATYRLLAKPRSRLKTNSTIMMVKPPSVLLAYAWTRKLSKEDESQTQQVNDVEKLVQTADNLYAQNKFQEVLQLLMEYKDSDEVELLWRLSRVQYNVSQEPTTAVEERKALIGEAYRIIQKSLALNSNHFANHKWMSILLDSQSQYDGIKARISNLETVKFHMLKAVELNKNDATTLYMLGVWCFEIASMPWYQRKIASTIFASPPTSSFEEALEFFLKAEEAEPRFYSRNLLMLGKTYMSLGNEENARYYLDLASNYPANTDEDRLVNKEAFDLMNKLKVGKDAKS